MKLLTEHVASLAPETTQIAPHPQEAKEGGHLGGSTPTTQPRAAQSNVFELEIFESVVLGLKLPNYQFNSIKRIR